MMLKNTLHIDATLNGRDLFGEPIRRAVSGPVAERFGVPPFSVLDARQGDPCNVGRVRINAGNQAIRGGPQVLQDAPKRFGILQGRLAQGYRSV